ncbi:hypothetical protein PM082_022983 [Marasmius tenuissimus]|nr:hypothetical protein PM082_022983 [Marasmius tenuissimus]
MPIQHSYAQSEHSKKVSRSNQPNLYRQQLKIPYPGEGRTVTDSTTDIGEGQHYWSRRMTGSDLPSLTSVFQARKSDKEVALANIVRHESRIEFGWYGSEVTTENSIRCKTCNTIRP